MWYGVYSQTSDTITNMGVKEYSLEPIGASKPGRCIVTLSHEKHYWPFARGIHRWPMNSFHKRPMVQSFYFFFDVSLSKLFSKLSSCGWYEMPRRPSDVIVVRHNLMRLLLQYIISNEICMRSCCACICCGYGGVPVLVSRSRHYCDVIMSPTASQITSLTIVYSIDF